VLALASTLGTPACVSQVVHDRAMADAAKAQADADAKIKDQGTQLQGLEQRLAEAEALTQERDARLNELSTSSHNLQAELDQATAINDQLRTALDRAGKDVDKILIERGTLTKALDDARVRIEDLRRAQATAEVRTEFFRDLEKRFQPLASAGQLKIESRGGRVVMNVRGDLLFDAGHADLRPAGKGALMEIAHALQAAPGRRFAVTASVDDAPFKSKQFESVWDLTSARAVTVVKYLVSLGVPADSLVAAGAGAYDPIAPNDSDEDRARNRRVEIAVLPAPADAPRTPPQTDAPRPAPEAPRAAAPADASPGAANPI